MNKTKTIGMYSLLLLLASLVLALPSVMATGLSPTSLTYNLNPGEEACQNITVESTSQTIEINDSWAENNDINWSVNLFDKDASYHGISIKYDKELSSKERQVEICLSGSATGEYHGVILLKQKQEGNSIIQMGVWILVTITEPEPPAAIPSSGGGGGSSGGGGGGGSPSVTNTNQTSANNNTNTTNKNVVYGISNSNETNKKDTGNKIGITGSIINGISKPSTIGIGVGIMLIGAVFVYNRKRIKQKFRRGE